MAAIITTDTRLWFWDEVAVIYLVAFIPMMLDKGLS